MSQFAVLALHAEVTEVEPEGDWESWQQVKICIGSCEIARIKGDDIVYYDGSIDLEETAARWLRERLADSRS